MSLYASRTWIRTHASSYCAHAHTGCAHGRGFAARARSTSGASSFSARDVLPVPVSVVTVGKGSSAPAEAMAGTSRFPVTQPGDALAGSVVLHLLFSFVNCLTQISRQLGRCPLRHRTRSCSIGCTVLMSGAAQLALWPCCLTEPASSSHRWSTSNSRA